MLLNESGAEEAQMWQNYGTYPEKQSLPFSSLDRRPICSLADHLSRPWARCADRGVPSASLLTLST
jgi:hypothetical protein